jgi:hypothetical protein
VKRSSARRKVRRQRSPRVAFSGGPPPEHPYLSVEFREKLRAQAYQLLVNADFARSADGTRFDKGVTETPLFQAIRYLRTRPHQLGHTAEVASLPPYDPRHARTLSRYVLEAVSLDDLAALANLTMLVRLQSSVGKRVCESEKFIPWGYYAAHGALYYLDQGVLPTRVQVQNEAIRKRVLEELLTSKVAVRAGSLLANRGLVNAKFDDVIGHKQPKNWRRIFRELGLAELL